MKRSLVALACGMLFCIASGAQTANTWSAQDVDFYAGDFNGDGYTDILYVARSASAPSGIILSDGSSPTIAGQAWASDYLGIPWSSNAYTVTVGDFNGDGKTDIFLQSESPGDSYLLLTDSTGIISAISQTVPDEYMGLEWSAGGHHLVAGDFNGDGHADLFLQPVSPGGTSAIVYSDANGQYTTPVPAQAWADGYLGFNWSTSNAVVLAGDFNGDGQADLLIQAWPNNLGAVNNVPVYDYPPNLNGVVLAQPGGSPFSVVGVQSWNRNSFGVDWSPLINNLVIGDFNGDGRADVLMQPEASNGVNYLLMGNAPGPVFTAPNGALPSSVAVSGDTAQLIVGKFAGGEKSGLLVQSRSPSANNWIAGNLVNGITASAVAFPTLTAASVTGSNLRTSLDTTGLSNGLMVQQAATATAPVTSPGRTPGQFSVTSVGGAAYRIPLWTPPGARKIEPNLELLFSSDQPDGPLGPGWTVSGLSMITRCAKTWASSGGAPAAIALATTDDLCLDGNRLRLTSGTQGVAGSTYQTEIANFSNVTAYSVQGNGPQYFYVQGKDGRTYEYGNTTDSRLFGAGATTPYAWALNKVRDRQNNNMTISYSPTAGTAVTVTKINYTATPGTSSAAPYEVDFNYVARAGGTAITKYIGGNATAQTQQLDNINVLANNVSVRKYLLTYTASSTTSRPTLTGVQECGGNAGTDCLRPTVIVYQPGASGWTTVAQTSGINAPNGIYHPDLNGDGIPDALYARPSGSYLEWYARVGSLSGFGAEIDTGAATDPRPGSVAPYPIIGRFSGTKKTQFLAPVIAGTIWYVWELADTGTTFQAPVSTTLATDLTKYALDYDGDGLPDLLVGNYDTLGASAYIRRNITAVGGPVRFSTTTQLVYTAGSNQYLALESTVPADFNGDGRADLLAATVANTKAGAWHWTALLSKGFGSAPTSSSLNSTSTHAVTGDFNGDGCSDVFTPLNVYISNCAGGFQAVATAASATGSDTIQFLAVDWDGDGQTDIIWQDWTTLQLKLQKSLGSSLAAPVGLGLFGSLTVNPGKQYFAVDLDADGQQDLVYVDTSSSFTEGYYGHNSTNTLPDFLTSATDGFGITFNPTYVSITHGSYTLGTTAVFPDIDFQAPVYVVNGFTASDGKGGTYTNSFSYYQARMNLQGRGFEGFIIRYQNDSRNGVYNHKYYRTDFPYIGMVYQDVSHQSDGTLTSKVVNTPNYTTLAGTGCNVRCFPYIQSSTSYRYEVAGAKEGISTANTVTNFTYDTYGNLIDTVATTTDTDSTAPASPFNGQSWISEITNTITNNTANWCLGIPTRTQTINTVPGQVAQTRTVDHPTANIDYGACRASKEVIEPNDTKLKVTTTFGFDACGNTNSVSVVGLDKNGTAMPARTTGYDFKTRCQFPETVTNALGQQTLIGYQYDLGVLASVTDPNSISVSWTYDHFGRKKTESRPDSTSTSWTYSDCVAATCWGGNTDLRVRIQEQIFDSTATLVRQIFTFTDGLERTRLREWDGTLGVFEIEQNTYDNLGRRVKAFMPYSSGASGNGYHYYTYDVANRVVQDDLHNASGAVYRTSMWGYSGQTSTAQDPNGNTVTTVTDVVGRIRWVTDPNTNGTVAGTTKYTFDAFGNLITLLDANSVTSSYGYNIRGFKTSSTDADSGAWTFTPNSLNELVAQLDAKSQTTSFVYDPLGRLTSRTEPESSTPTSIVYGSSITAHNIGRVYTVSKPDGYGEKYLYDTAGRMQTATYTEDAVDYPFDYTYNNLGTIDTLTYPPSTPGVRLAVKYVYDAYGYLNQVQNNAGGAAFWTLNSANDSNLPTLETLGNGAQITSGYIPWTNEITSRSVGSGGSTNNLQNLAYQWDFAGNLHQRQDVLQSLTEVYAYDSMNRLKKSTLNGTDNLTMTYTASGNINTKSDVSASAYVYDTTHKHEVKTAGTWSMTYDANGNMATRAGGTISNYSYNLPNTLNYNGNSTQFFYNADHQRWKQIANYAGTTETTHYVGGLLEVVTTVSGPAEYRHQIPAGSSRAIYIRRSDATVSTYYATSDHLGSSDLVMNGQGSVAVRESFTPFGERRGSNWTGTPTTTDYNKIAISTRRGFTDHEMIDSVSLIHMNGRVYDPKLGRFLSVDPTIQSLAASQTVNPYTYVMNNPLAFADPSGYSVDGGGGSGGGGSGGGGGPSGGDVFTFIFVTIVNFVFGPHHHQPYRPGPSATVPQSLAQTASSETFFSVGAPDASESAQQSLMDQNVHSEAISQSYYNRHATVASENNVPPNTLDTATKGVAQKHTTSLDGIDFIQDWEKWNGTVDKKTGLTFAKDDGYGNSTIGWGHNCGKCDDFENGITREQGDALFKSDLAQFERAVNSLGVTLSQQQFDALVSFALNVAGFKRSILFGNVSSGSPVTEANFTSFGNAYNSAGELEKVPGLMRRRRGEYNMYANGIYDSSH